jgi:hypothetical protein
MVNLPPVLNLRTSKHKHNGFIAETNDVDSHNTLQASTIHSPFQAKEAVNNAVNMSTMTILRSRK